MYERTFWPFRSGVVLYSISGYNKLNLHNTAVMGPVMMPGCEGNWAR